MQAGPAALQSPHSHGCWLHSVSQGLLVNSSSPGPFQGASHNVADCKQGKKSTEGRRLQDSNQCLISSLILHCFCILLRSKSVGLGHTSKQMDLHKGLNERRQHHWEPHRKLSSTKCILSQGFFSSGESLKF